MPLPRIRAGLHALVPALLLLCGAACTPEPAHPERGRDTPDTGQNPTGGVNAPRWLDAPAVVLVSFDGFRHDYLERFRPPAFLGVAQEGLRAQALVPPFPSKTFPAHYTIATGLRPSHHGITGNRFLDPERGAMYAMGDREAVGDGSWYRGEPLWVTAERQGMVAASYFFVGSEADVGGMRPSHWFPYDGSVPGEARVDQVLAWLAQPPETRPRMITLYFSAVDGAGHRHGPDSPEVEAAVAQVDGHLARLLAGIDRLPHGDRVAVVLVSDHGMAAAPRDRAHGIDFSALPDVRLVERGPYGILAVESADPVRPRAVRDAVAAQLPERVEVFLRTEAPERLHVRASPRFGDVIVLPPLGETVHDAARMPESDGFTHGWDPQAPEMHGILLARGAGIRPGARLPAVHAVDVYGLVAGLLGLAPASHDGNTAVFAPALVEERP